MKCKMERETKPKMPTERYPGEFFNLKPFETLSELKCYSRRMNLWYYYINAKPVSNSFDSRRGE
jgi:hypothetical protein